MTLWLQITSGQGPGECQLVVARVAEVLQREADKFGVECRISFADCNELIERGTIPPCQLAPFRIRSHGTCRTNRT